MRKASVKRDKSPKYLDSNVPNRGRNMASKAFEAVLIDRQTKCMKFVKT